MARKETLLTYPDFNKPFVIHTDSSHTQLGAVISQENKPISFYSRKLNPAQTRYTTTEREPLSIVETLKEFQNILLGQQIEVHTDHKNLTCRNFNTERVMRWKLILEEYNPDLKYIKGENSVVADALSRFPMLNLSSSPMQMEQFSFEDDYLPPDTFPLTFKTLMVHQQQDELLQQIVKDNNQYSPKIFRGGGKTRELIVKSGKIVVSATLQQRCMQWYHESLCYPGSTRTEDTIRQHFTWKNLRGDVEKACKKCKLYQFTKKKSIKYGKLPHKEVEAKPWGILCVDMIGPYKISYATRKETILELWAVTMIDQATGWFKIVQVENKESHTVAEVVEQAWLCRYPWPTTIILDRGSEFMEEFARMIKGDYGIKKRAITARNPQENSIIERVHQTIG